MSALFKGIIALLASQNCDIFRMFDSWGPSEVELHSRERPRIDFSGKSLVFAGPRGAVLWHMSYSFT